MKAAILLCMILSGFLVMLVLSYCLSRRERAYNFSLTIFIIFLIGCQLVLYQTIIKGAKIEYGDEFYRKLYVFDPAKNETVTINDDGSFVVKNGTLVGRISLDDAKFIETMKLKAEFEPALMYTVRYLFLVISFLSMIFVLVTIILVSMYFCFHLIDEVKTRKQLSHERAMKNIAIMRMMNCLPYSNFILSEAKDCPICLQEFTPQCQVV